MPYITPGEVRSPKSSWQLIDVLLDRGPGDCAYALGEWDGERRIGFRWNGTDQNPLGNPQSRGLPTWTMLDPKMHEAVIGVLPPDKQSLARRFLGTGLQFEMVSVDDGSILLWDMRRNPPTVAKVECNVVRDVIGEPTIPDDACRLVAEQNRELLTEAAEALFAAKRYRVGANGSPQIELGLTNLQPFASRFSTSVLRVAAGFRWLG